MKPFILFIIFSAAICLSFSGFRKITNPVYVTGHLKINPDYKAVDIAGVTVMVKGDDKILTKTLTDTKGDFDLQFTPYKEKYFDFFYCNGVTRDTLLIGSYTTFESDDMKITFYAPAKRKKNHLGQTLCPKCRKPDKVGSTNVGLAKYYCQRDKVKF